MAQLINTPLFGYSSLKSYWRMEGNSNDSKGSTNGTDTDITYNLGNGKYIQGAGFNGTSSKITGNFTQPTSSYTVAMWITFGGTVADTNYRLWDTQESGTPTTGLVFAYNPSLGGSTTNLRVYHNNGAWSTSDALGSLIGSTFAHVCVTWDGSNTAFYVNGVAKGGGAYSTAITNGGNFDIGHGRATATFWNGKIDDVAIFDTALNNSQISLLVSGGSLSLTNVG